MARSDGRETLNKIFNEYGIEHNAATTPDYTVYYEIIPVDKLEIVIDIEADRMQGLLLSDEELFTKEKQVIIEERKKRIEDDPIALTSERFLATAFTSNPYRVPVIGWMHDVQALDLEDIRFWYKNWYVPNNALVVVVGDIKPKKVFDMVQKHFGNLRRGEITEPKSQKEVEPLGERKATVKLQAERSYLLMGYNVPTLKTSEPKWKAYALIALKLILSGGNSARLEDELVKTEKIAVFVSASYDAVDRLDSLFVLEGIPALNHTVEDLRLAFLRQIIRLQTVPLTSEELERIKMLAQSSEVYKKDNIKGMANSIGHLESVGLSWQYADNFAQSIDSLTSEQIQAVAKKFLTPDKITVVDLQPLQYRTQQFINYAESNPAHLMTTK